MKLLYSEIRIERTPICKIIIPEIFEAAEEEGSSAASFIRPLEVFHLAANSCAQDFSVSE